MFFYGYRFTEDLIPLLNERAGYPPDTKLSIYEEIKAHTVQEIDIFDEPLEKVTRSMAVGMEVSKIF